MNTAILHTKVQQFITDNLKTNITKLILKGSPFSDVSIQELANQIVSKQKSEYKLASWFRTEQIYYPPRINIEQTSSEHTANYKSNLVTGTSIIDITGGFGIVGMITAVPLYTALKVILKEFLSDNKIVKSITKDI